MKHIDDMTILAIDSSTHLLRLAIRFGGDRLVQNRESVDKSHGQIVIKRLEELLASAGLGLDDVDAIAVAVGPGSFTGLRIGLAVAKGMVMALDIPVVPVTAFEIAAARLQGIETPVQIIIPLNRDECIRCAVTPETRMIGEPVVERYHVLPTAIGGEAVAAIGFDLRIEVPGLPGRDYTNRLDYDGADLVYIAAEKLESNRAGADVATLEPLYLQKSQAEVRFERRYKEQ